MHVRFLCMPCKSEVSISSSPFGTPVVKSHWHSKPNVLGLVFPVPEPWAVEPDVGLRFHSHGRTSAV